MMCKYCKSDNAGVQAFYKNDIGNSISITAAIVPDKHELALDYSNGSMGYIDVVDIKYCPFCGRKLQEGPDNV